MGKNKIWFPVCEIVDPRFCFMIKRCLFIGSLLGKLLHIHTGSKFFQECFIQNKIACFHHAVKSNDRRRITLILLWDIGSRCAFPISLYITSAPLLHHHMYIPLDHGRIKGNIQFFIYCRLFRLQLSRNDDYLTLISRINLPIRDIRRIFDKCPSAIRIIGQHHAAQAKTADT